MFDQERIMNLALRATANIPCPRLTPTLRTVLAPPLLESRPWDRASAFVKALSPWLRAAPRPTQEISAAICRFIPYAAEEPREVDFLNYLPEALTESGFEAQGLYLDDLTWQWRSRFGREPSVNPHQASGFLEVLDQPAQFRNVFTVKKPSEIRRVIDLMVMLNARWLREEYRETSAIVRGFFPAACQEACRSWLISETEDTLWEVGYTPIYQGSEPSGGGHPDPVWFCDGDVRDVLSYAHLSSIHGA